MSFRAIKKDIERLYEQLELVASPDIEPMDDVMEWICEYLYSSYFMSINPLTGIRKVLPQYTWTFHRVKSFEAAKRITQQADFIWCVNAFGGILDGDEIELVTATLNAPRKPLRLFHAGEKKASEGDKLTSEIKLAQDCGGEPQYSVITNM